VLQCNKLTDKLTQSQDLSSLRRNLTGKNNPAERATLMAPSMTVSTVLDLQLLHCFLASPIAYNLAITCYNLPFLHFTLRLEQFALHQGIQRFQAPAHLVS